METTSKKDRNDFLEYIGMFFAMLAIPAIVIFLIIMSFVVYNTFTS